MLRPDPSLQRFAAIFVTAATLSSCTDQSTPTRLLAPSSPLRTEVSASPAVNSLADDGDGTCTDTKCTLRDAIAFASPGATITFSVTGTIMLATGALVVEKNLTISGPGASQLAVNAELTGQSVFFIARSHASLSGLTIELGFNANGGSGIFNSGVLTLANVSIDNNLSNFGAGGGILNTGTLTIIASTISRNASPVGSAIYNSGDATITNSTISGSGNEGILPSAAIENTGALILINSTVSNNQVPAIDNRAGFMALFSTIVSTTRPSATAITPITTDGGYNIEDGTTCGFTAATSHSNTNPGLDPAGLLSNGGPTPTIGLLTGALAVDLDPHWRQRVWHDDHDRPARRRTSVRQRMRRRRLRTRLQGLPPADQQRQNESDSPGEGRADSVHPRRRSWSRHLRQRVAKLRADCLPTLGCRRATCCPPSRPATVDSRTIRARTSTRMSGKPTKRGPGPAAACS